MSEGVSEGGVPYKRRYGRLLVDKYISETGREPLRSGGQFTLTSSLQPEPG